MQLRFAVALALTLTAALAARAQESAPDEPRLVFFPSAEISFSSPDQSTPAALWAILVSESPWLPTSQPIQVSRGEGGAYRFLATCSFLGRGEIRFQTSAIDSNSAVHAVPISCGPEEFLTPQAVTPELPESGVSFSALATTAAAPVEVEAVVDSYVIESVRSSSSRLDITTCNGQTTSSPGSSLTISRETLSAGVVCSYLRSSNGNETTTCRSLGPTTEVPHRLGQVGQSFELQERVSDTDRASGSLPCAPGASPGAPAITRFVENLEWTARADVTISFPSLPEGSSIDAVRGLSSVNGYLARKPLHAYLLNGTAPTVATETIVPSDCAETTITGAGIEWRFASPTLMPGNRLSFSLEPEALCRDANEGAGRVAHDGFLRLKRVTDLFPTAGRLLFRATVATPEIVLTLQPGESRVAPIWRRRGGGPIDGLGRPDTELRVSITGGAPDVAYEILVEETDFDASEGGHNGSEHVTGPPREQWGELDGNAGDAGQLPTSACEIPADENGEGSCTVQFQSGQVGGSALFRATLVAADGQPPSGPSAVAEAGVAVNVSPLGLMDVEGLFGRTNELLVSTRVHHPKPWHLEGFVAAAAQRLQAHWEEQAPGSYLSFNDMSLRNGGLFDQGSSWDPLHSSHRKGTSMDINTALRTSCPDPPNPNEPCVEGGTVAAVVVDGEVVSGVILPDNSNGLRSVLKEVCDSVGLRLLSRGEDASLHCEYEGISG